jgi:hypothetical protein
MVQSRQWAIARLQDHCEFDALVHTEFMPHRNAQAMP